jgi:hypothetical protein
MKKASVSFLHHHGASSYRRQLQAWLKMRPHQMTRFGDGIALMCPGPGALRLEDAVLSNAQLALPDTIGQHELLDEGTKLHKTPSRSPSIFAPGIILFLFSEVAFAYALGCLLLFYDLFQQLWLQNLQILPSILTYNEIGFFSISLSASCSPCSISLDIVLCERSVHLFEMVV